jgi:hypothetical protein
MASEAIYLGNVLETGTFPVEYQHKASLKRETGRMQDRMIEGESAA